MRSITPFLVLAALLVLAGPPPADAARSLFVAVPDAGLLLHAQPSGAGMRALGKDEAVDQTQGPGVGRSDSCGRRGGSGRRGLGRTDPR